jgi:molybdopterin synthase catalytic subunit
MARIVREPIDERAELEAVRAASAGAVLCFAGTVRDHHAGRKVTALEYHAYETMALKELNRIEETIGSRWSGARASIVHRIGYLLPAETSVFIAVSTAHRAEGFEALSFAIETLKRTAPIWKKEMYPDGHAWIEGS